MIKAAPLISVIMPCYNEQDYVAKAIRSILNQTYGNFELIVVDDCSTDNSVEMIKELAKEDSRVIFLKNAKNVGVSKTINYGLSVARGEYIARLDADDTCDSTRFQKQIEYFQSNPNCILCGTYGDVYDGKNTRIEGNGMGNLKKHLVKNNSFVHSSVMFRRLINDVAVRYPEVKAFEDYGLWIELCNKGEFHVIPEILVHRTDIKNLETKKTWEGFNKLKIYKEIRTYQIKAIKETKFWGYGIMCLCINELKIIFATMSNILKGQL